MPIKTRQTKARASALRDELEVADSWQITSAERALRFSEQWDALVDQAPEEIRVELRRLGERIAANSPTFKRLPPSN